MPRIKVETNRLRSVSREFQQVSQELSHLEGRLRGAIGGLDWEARGQANIDGRASDARGRARALSGQAEGLARFLVTAAQAFDDADRQGVGAVAQVHQTFVEAQREWIEGPFGPRATYPGNEVDRQLQLGQLIVEGQPVPSPFQVSSTEVQPEDVDEALTWTAHVVDLLKDLKDVSAVYAALAIGYVAGDGVTILSGSHLLKGLAGLSEYLTRIKVENLPWHMAKVGAAFSVLSAIPQWLRDVRDYREEGAAKVLAAGAVDGFLKIGMSMVSGSLGAWAGGALVVALLGPAAPAAVVAAGAAVALGLGWVGDQVFNWLSKTGYRDAAINWVESHVTQPVAGAIEAAGQAVGSAIESAGQAVDSVLGSAVRAVQNISLPSFLPSW